jgi:AAHS family 4-hydroxybenzoate transporter-like MFS transporter
VGALLAALIAPTLIGRWGWPAIFLAGGLGPLLLALLVLASLPESLPLLALQVRRAGDLAESLRRYAPDFDVARLVPERRTVESAGSIRALVGPRYLPRTLAFWATFSIAAFLVYMLTSWLPVLLGGAGWSRDASVRGITWLQGGGLVGALLLARCIDRGLTVMALCTAYGVAGLAGIGFSLMPATGWAWPLLLAVLGAAVSGGMFGLLAVGALLYPPQLRAAGLGAGGAVSRVGAILGPLVGGWVLAFGVAPATILAWLALPAGCVALIIGILRHRLRPDTPD